MRPRAQPRPWTPDPGPRTPDTTLSSLGSRPQTAPWPSALIWAPRFPALSPQSGHQTRAPTPDHSTPLLAPTPQSPAHVPMGASTATLRLPVLSPQLSDFTPAMASVHILPQDSNYPHLAPNLLPGHRSTYQTPTPTA